MTIATLILGIFLQIGRPPRVLQSPACVSKEKADSASLRLFEPQQRVIF